MENVASYLPVIQGSKWSHLAGWIHCGYWLPAKIGPRSSWL